jgi:hypothetical protein
MSTAEPVRQRDPYGTPSTRTGWYGYIRFAGIIMCILGAFHVIMGTVALFESDYFMVGENGLMIEVDYNGWGWTHLILGLLVGASGVCLTLGATWARMVAIVAAVLSSIVNVSFLSAYPIWSALMILFDVLVIYAVTVHGDRDSLEGY